MLNLNILSCECLHKPAFQMIAEFHYFSLFSLGKSLSDPKNFQPNLAVRSVPAKGTRWLTGNTGYTLMGMVRSSRLTVKVICFAV